MEAVHLDSEMTQIGPQLLICRITAVVSMGRRNIKRKV